MSDIIYLVRYVIRGYHEEMAFLDYDLLIEYMKKNDIDSFSCNIVKLFH